MVRSAWRVAVVGVLIAATIGAAMALTAFDAGFGSESYYAPDAASQFAGSWRLDAVYAFTSGTMIGHICAVFAGYLGAIWWDPGRGVVLGTGIGVANLAMSVHEALPITYGAPDAKYAYADKIIKAVDLNPLHQPAVLIAMALVVAIAGFLAWLGTEAARRPRRRWNPLLRTVAAVPIGHLIAAALLSPAWFIGLLSGS